MQHVGKELARCVRTTSETATSVSSVKRGGIKRNTSLRMAVNLLEIRRGYLPSVQNMLCTILLFHTLLFWYQQLTAFCYFDSKGYAITAPMSLMWLHQALKRNEVQPNYFRPWKKIQVPSPCLTDNRRPSAPPDALPELRPTPRLEEDVSQSKTGARQTIALTVIFSKYNKNSLERRAGAERSSRKRKPLYNATAYSLTKSSDQTSFRPFHCGFYKTNNNF